MIKSDISQKDTASIINNYEVELKRNFVRICYRIYFKKQPFKKWAKLLNEFHQTKLYDKEEHELSKKIIIRRAFEFVDAERIGKIISQYLAE